MRAHESRGTTTQAPTCQPEPFPKHYTCAGAEGRWAEALQKTLRFFSINKSGPGRPLDRLQWRSDAHTGDGHTALDPADPNGANLPQDFIDRYCLEAMIVKDRAMRVILTPRSEN